VNLGYHDVIAPGEEDSSGFPGPDAGRYKLTWDRFREHLDAIAAAAHGAPVTAADMRGGALPQRAWSLTFDDGGASSPAIADELAARGWRGQFFVTTGRIGTPEFVDEGAIRRLVAGGHVVGSHSHTHPQRMAALTPEELEREWRESGDRLEQVLGQRPFAAAVPGGWYSTEVAAAAAAAGVTVLYTSEPTLSMTTVGDCLVLGRFGLLHGSSARTAAGLAARRVLPRAGRRARRMLLAPAKRVSGEGYLRVRARLLRLGDR
jgi:peptidoglycan/xylan/chitin deacetylase (PgdA/CDA1 family)